MSIHVLRMPGTMVTFNYERERSSLIKESCSIIYDVYMLLMIGKNLCDHRK